MTQLLTLETYKMPIRVSQAAEELENLLRHHKLAILYRHFFPAEFKASTASCVPEHGQAYSALELEFFERLATLFPFNNGYYEDNEEFTDYMDVIPFGFSLDSGEEYRPAVVLLLCMFGKWEIWNVADEELFKLLADLEGSKEISPSNLEIVVNQYQIPEFKLFPLAIEVISCNTGNYWLDTTIEDFLPDEVFSVEAISYYRSEWDAAEKILEKFNHFLDFLESSTENIKEAIEIWNSAI